MMKLLLILSSLCICACTPTEYPSTQHYCQTINDALEKESYTSLKDYQMQQHEKLRLIKLYQDSDCKSVLNNSSSLN